MEPQHTELSSPVAASSQHPQTQPSSSSAPRLPPHEVSCRFWKKGYCFRGTSCFFKHAEAEAGIDKPSAKPAPTPSSSKDAEAQPQGPPPLRRVRPDCGICLETPKTYGLLTDCDHPFCLECLRTWRSSSVVDRNRDDNPHAMRENTKTCPLCRTKSLYVVPSPHFPRPPSPIEQNGGEDKENIEPTERNTDTEARTHDAIEHNDGTISTTNEHRDQSEPRRKPNPEKDRIIRNYLRRKKQIPCRYFEDSVRRWRDYNAQRNAQVIINHSPPRQNTPFQPRCRFANECHYAHIHPETREPYVFSAQELKRMEDNRRIRVFRNTRRWNLGLEGNFLQLLSELGLPLPSAEHATSGPEYNNLTYDGFERRDRIIYHDHHQDELASTALDEEDESAWEDHFSDAGMNYEDFGGFPTYDDEDEAFWTNADVSDDGW